MIVICRRRAGLCAMEIGGQSLWTRQFRKHTNTSCCRKSRCSVPPPETPDILRSLLFERPVELWGWNDSVWKKMPQKFTYYDEHSAVGYAKRFLAIAVATTFVLGILSVMASLLHQEPIGSPEFASRCTSLRSSPSTLSTPRRFEKSTTTLPFVGNLSAPGSSIPM